MTIAKQERAWLDDGLPRVSQSLGSKQNWILCAMQLKSIEDVLEALRRRAMAERTIVAIAGPPGSGKSTIAARIVDELNSGETRSAAVLGMDGFHYDDLVLNERGWRARKGAPETFDVAGLEHLLGRLRHNSEAEIAVPVFDRAIEISRAGALIIPRSTRFVIVEGNYLLLKPAPWANLLRYYDMTVYLQVDDSVLRERLETRWRLLGFDHDQIQAKVVNNDLPNALLVRSQSQNPDFLIRAG
jgi:pantothenate kinase